MGPPALWRDPDALTQRGIASYSRGLTCPAAGLRLVAVVVAGCARVLRGTCLDVRIGAVLTSSAALAQVGVDARDRVHWSGRATLLRKPEDIGIYDQVFATYWERRAVPVDCEYAPGGGARMAREHASQPVAAQPVAEPA